MKLHLVALLFLSLSTLIALAQEETSTSASSISSISVSSSSSTSSSSKDNEESNIPRKVLRKYRIRRPVVVDQNGIAITARSTPKLRRVRVNKQPITETPKLNEQSQSSQQSQQSIVATPENLLDSRYASPLVQQNPNDPIVVEPVRFVPQYRKATSSSARQALLANVNLKDRQDSGSDDGSGRKPHIGTTRNYSHINEDGSFTFGYEGEDGSFKEETRGIDCVVRGKYGYVDPDGVRREFSYVSGNPCDPNNPDKDSQDEGLDGPEEIEDFSQVRPTGIISNRPRRPVGQQPRPRPVITNDFSVNNDVEQSLAEQAAVRQRDNEAVFQIVQRPQYRTRAQPLLQRVPTPERETYTNNNNAYYQPTTFRPRFRIPSTTTPAPTTPPPPATTPSTVFQQYYGRNFQGFNAPLYYQNQPPQPLYHESSQTLEDQQQNGVNGFNFDQELQRIQQYQPGPVPTAQPQQQFHYSQSAPQQEQQYFQSYQPQQQATTPSPRPVQQRQIFGGKNAAELLQKYHYPQLYQSQTVEPEVPRARAVPQYESSNSAPQSNNYGNYRTELIYDPSSGQYTSVLVQDIPKTDQEFTLTQKLRAFVDNSQPQSRTGGQYYNNPAITIHQQLEP